MAAAPPWDLEYDVVVAGYGYAGAMAAIAAHDEGREVGIFEKMAHFGGNSILSGGSVAVAREYEPALTYLRRTSMGTTDDEVLQTFARGMVELPGLLGRLAANVGFEIVESRDGPTYLRTPPFYCIEAWPIITNTQGGLVHNASQQIVDPSAAASG